MNLGGEAFELVWNFLVATRRVRCLVGNWLLKREQGQENIIGASSIGKGLLLIIYGTSGKGSSTSKGMNGSLQWEIRVLSGMNELQ